MVSGSQLLQTYINQGCQDLSTFIIRSWSLIVNLPYLIK